MNEEIQKAKDKADETSQKINDWVDEAAEKHNFPKWKVWVGIGIAALAVVGAVKVMGLL
ncbi:MAG: hypothetical protein E6X17_04810 [Sporomusaceae bacterium]|nr:hypothetical protein [Sporomusaceae bacterium]